MLRSSLHTHSIYDDGSDTIRQMIDSARSRGFCALGFSGHSPVSFDESTMSHAGMEVWKQEVLQAKEQTSGLSVFLGIELDSLSSISLDGFDYVIGSVHYLLPDGIPVPIDASRELFRALLTHGYQEDIHALARDYYAAVKQMIETRPLTIVGHFDLFSKYNEGQDFFRFDDEDIIAMAMDAAAPAIERGLLFEINTGAIARGYRSLPYPHPLLLERLARAGARFTISSDCHARSRIDCGFEQIFTLCQKAGIRTLELPVEKNGQLCFEARPLEEWIG